jgi:hypothetical protein
MSSPGTPVSSTNKTEILLKVALNTIRPSQNQSKYVNHEYLIHMICI